MAGFGDRLASMKKAQEEAEKSKQEKAAAEAAEAAAQEREAKMDALSKRRESIGAELEQATAEASEASEAVADAEAFAAEAGEDLDPGAKAEFDALKQEAGEVIAKFEAMKTEIAEIDAEIASLEGGEANEPVQSEEAPAEEAEAAPAEKMQLPDAEVDREIKAKVEEMKQAASQYGKKREMEIKAKAEEMKQAFSQYGKKTEEAQAGEVEPAPAEVVQAEAAGEEAVENAEREPKGVEEMMAQLQSVNKEINAFLKESKDAGLENIENPEAKIAEATKLRSRFIESFQETLDVAQESGDEKRFAQLLRAFDGKGGELIAKLGSSAERLVKKVTPEKASVSRISTAAPMSRKDFDGIMSILDMSTAAQKNEDPKMRLDDQIIAEAGLLSRSASRLDLGAHAMSGGYSDALSSRIQQIYGEERLGKKNADILKRNLDNPNLDYKYGNLNKLVRMEADLQKNSESKE